MILIFIIYYIIISVKIYIIYIFYHTDRERDTEEKIVILYIHCVSKTKKERNERSVHYEILRDTKISRNICIFNQFM